MNTFYIKADVPLNYGGKFAPVLEKKMNHQDYKAAVKVVQANANNPYRRENKTLPAQSPMYTDDSLGLNKTEEQEWAEFEESLKKKVCEGCYCDPCKCLPDDTDCWGE